MKGKLTPFDTETIVMVQSVIGKDVKIAQSNSSFSIVADTSELSHYIQRAVIDAVRGRCGDKLIRYDEGKVLTFEISYTPGSENMPDEIRDYNQVPRYDIGDMYVSKIDEDYKIRAMEVTKENAQRLIEFLGGGFCEILPNGDCSFTYITDNGILATANEGDYIVYNEQENCKEIIDGELLDKMYKIRPDDMLAELFGIEYRNRIFKLKEEVNELEVAAENFVTEHTENNYIKLYEELADVNIIIYHIAKLLGRSQEELLKSAALKIKERINNPDFQRDHIHFEHCGGCKKFMYEDVNGYGICEITQHTKSCWDVCEMQDCKGTKPKCGNCKFRKIDSNQIPDCIYSIGIPQSDDPPCTEYQPDEKKFK